MTDGLRLGRSEVLRSLRHYLSNGGFKPPNLYHIWLGDISHVWVLTDTLNFTASQFKHITLCPF